MRDLSAGYPLVSVLGDDNLSRQLVVLEMLRLARESGAVLVTEAPAKKSVADAVKEASEVAGSFAIPKAIESGMPYYRRYERRRRWRA